MTQKVAPIPKGYNSITPYLIINNAAAAIDFYKKVFSAKEIMSLNHPGGKIGHAEIQIGDSKIMLADEFPEMGAKGPEAFGGSPITIHLYVENVDEIAQRATEAGAKIIRPLTNTFYGDRTVGLVDPFGHSWHIATHIEDISEEELRKRMATFEKKGECG